MFYNTNYVPPEDNQITDDSFRDFGMHQEFLVKQQHIQHFCEMYYLTYQADN